MGIVTFFPIEALMDWMVKVIPNFVLFKVKEAWKQVYDLFIDCLMRPAALSAAAYTVAWISPWGSNGKI
jgi:hypothetical protein